MAEGWKQVFEDLRNALRGGPPPEQAAPAAVAEPRDEAPPPDAPEAAVAPDTSAAVAEPVDDTRAGNGYPAAPEAAAAALDAGPIEAMLYESSAPDSGISGAAAPDAAGATPAPAAAAEAQTLPDQVDATAQPRWRCYAGKGFTLLIVGAVLVNLFLRFDVARLWAQWTAPKPPAPDVLATFDGGQITTADLEEHFQLLVPEEYRKEARSLETLRKVVQEMAADETARRWAAEQKTDASETFGHTMQHITENINLDSFLAQLHEGGISIPESEIQAYYEANKTRFGDRTLDDVREEIRQTLVAEREDQYLKDYIERLKNNASITRDFALLDMPEPSEADLRAYYEANTQAYTMTAQFTVDMLSIPIGADENAARAQADQALTKIRSGAAFADIPAQVTGARVITGALVFAGEFGPEWDAAVQALQPNEISNILRAGSAFQIVRLVAAQPSRRLTFEEARPRVLATVRQQRTDAWMQDNGSKTLFTIKGKQFTLGQFYREYQEMAPEVQAQFAGAQGMKQLGDLLIDRLVLVEDTYDQLLEVKNKDRIDQTRLDVLKQMMDQQEVDDKIEVTDEEIRQFYDQNPQMMAPPPQARIRYIRIALGQTEDEQKTARARAEEAYQKLVPGMFQQGADFAPVAKEYSEDPETAANGGEFPGWIGETGNPLEPPELHQLHEIVLSLPVNQISPPFDLGDSRYIVQVIERKEPPPLTFDQARPYIKDLLTERKHDELQRQLQDQLAKKINLVIYDSALQAYYEKTAAQAGGAQPSGNP